ncbi:hypothetical protein BJ322DRAFT_1024191 [Thelephora terrestris]|uniref:Uncharacterized protein n=1 Tax=Thelephora terrestris TaxID=56493 RepID=A0A9P6L200_9AGAM|nr:hypothetical protein BJ322DRAFT_1024191 [Thelephora terrestris]
MDFSGNWVENDQLHAEEGYSSRSGFCFNGTGEWCNNDQAGLSLPPSVNDGTLLLFNMLVIPIPSFRVDSPMELNPHRLYEWKLRSMVLAQELSPVALYHKGQVERPLPMSATTQVAEEGLQVFADSNEERGLKAC